MIIDWSLRFGDIVSFLGFVIGGLSVIFMMQNKIDKVAMGLAYLTKTVDTQSLEISRFAELLNLMGKYEERFATLRRELDELKRGNGWIRNERQSLDGEYTK
jgi:hypothetical protein